MRNSFLDSISSLVTRRSDAEQREQAIDHEHAPREDSGPVHGVAQLPLLPYPVLREEVALPARRSRALNLMRTSTTTVLPTSRVLAPVQTRAARAHAPSLARQLLTEPERARLQVMQVQLRLTGLGLYDGPIDGHLSPETVTGIRHFQTLKGLRSSGTLAAGTLSALGVHALD